MLVHGAWLGGWCWKKVIPRLRPAGHDVFAPTLTGLGERAHLLSNILALLRTGNRPAWMSEEGLQLVRPFCEMLVIKGWPTRLMKPFAE
jgi:hypothetical protein